MGNVEQKPMGVTNVSTFSSFQSSSMSHHHVLRRQEKPLFLRSGDLPDFLGIIPQPSGAAAASTIAKPYTQPRSTQSQATKAGKSVTSTTNTKTITKGTTPAAPAARATSSFDSECKQYSSEVGIECHAIECYHVSCQSYKPKNLTDDEDWGGVVLYMKDNKTDWYCNGVHCRSGYIIIKKTKDVEKYNSSNGIVHGNVYKSVFEEELTPGVIGSGFAFYKKKLKFNSFTFNASNDKYHNNNVPNPHTMSAKEEEWVTKAVNNWIENYQQNTKVTEKLVFHANIPK